MTAVSVNNVHKSFVTYTSEWARFAAWFGAKPKLKNKTDILKGITFDISPGESIGIVGQNGAGKSTLLKIITGTMQPTQGSVTVNGRVAALLELGMGFNPDMTGRQNVYNSAGLMGFGQEDIDGLIKGIEDFAEIGAYFDQPVRVYSSGMQVRLAFAVATAVRPEILIVDEALSVGDAYFQHKSFGRIREFREAGTTLLLVSHDRASVIAICDRAILLNDGEVARDGAPEEVMDYYNALIADRENHVIEQRKVDGRVATRSGTLEASFESVRLLNSKGESTDTVRIGEELTLEMVVNINSDIDQLVAGYMIKDRLGQAIYGTNSFHMEQIQKNLKAGDKVVYTYKFPANIGYGNFSISTSLHSNETHIEKNYEWRDLAITFTALNANHPSFVGVAFIPPTLSVSR